MGGGPVEVNSKNSQDASIYKSGTLDYNNPVINVGNTGLNLGAILLPMQAPTENGGMGVGIVSRWLDANYQYGPNTSIPTASRTGETMSPYIVPVAVGVGALALMLVLLRKRKGG